MDDTNLFKLPDLGEKPSPIENDPQLADIIAMSKTQQKTDNLQQQKQDKISVLDPTTATGISNAWLDQQLNANSISADGVPESDYIDEIGASLYKGVQGIGHMLTDIGSWVADPYSDKKYHDKNRNAVSDYFDSIKYKTDDEINKYVGYDPSLAEYRQKQLGDSYDSFIDKPSLGGFFGGVVWNALKSAPTSLADSADIIVSAPVGGEGVFAKIAVGLNATAKAERANVARTSLEALTKVKNLRADANLALKQDVGMPNMVSMYEKPNPGDIVLNAFKTKRNATLNTFNESKDILQKAKILKKEGVLNAATQEKLAKNLKVFNALMPINRATFALGASATADNARQFKKDNNGNAASLGHIALTTLAQTLMMGADWSSIKMGMGLNVVKKSTADKVKNIFLGTRDNIVKATKHGKAYLIGDMIINSGFDVLKVAGAGLATNYIQQWTDIIGAQAGTAKHGSLSDVISNKKNQKEAALAGISGAGMTAAMRMTPMAVGVPLKATGIAATNMATKAFQAGQNHLTNLNYAMLSKDKRAEFNAKHEARVQAAEAELQAHNDAIDKIKNAKSMEELNNINDPAVASEVQHIIDSNFGSTTVHDEVRNAKSINDLMNVSDTIAKFTKAQTDKLNKPISEITPQELTTIKENVISANRAMHMANEGKADTELSNKIDFIKTPEELFKIVDEKDSEGKPLLSNELIGRIKAFKDNSNSVVPDKITDKQFSKLKEDIRKQDPELSDSIDNAKTLKDLSDIKELSADSKDSIKSMKEKLAFAALDSDKPNVYDTDKFNKLKTELKQVIQDNQKSPVMEQVKDKIDSIKNAAIAQHNEAITAKKLKLETERAKDYSYELYKNAKEGVKGIGKYIAGQFSDETVAAVLKAARTTKDLTSAAAKATLDTVKDADKSTVRAMIDDVARGKLNKRLYDFSKSELEDLKKSFRGNKKAQDVISRVQKNQQKALKAMGLSEDSKSDGLLGWLSDTTKSILKSPLAYRTQGLLHVKLNDLKDSKTIDKISKILDSVEEDSKKPDSKKLTSDQERILQHLKENVKKAKAALEEENNKVHIVKSELPKENTVSDEQKIADKINSSFSDTVNKVMNGELIITDKNVDGLNKEDIGTILSLGNQKLNDVMSDKNKYLTQEQLNNLEKASDSIMEHSKLPKEELTALAGNSAINYISTVEQSIASIDIENLANTNKGTSLENIDTIQLKEKEVKEAENKLKEFAKELGIKICDI